MILSTAMLLDRYADYQDPFGKIKRLCKEGKLHPITKGLYETTTHLDGKLLSSVIYGPSYLSFNYALSYYGLIPEAVYEYTSATCCKGKKKLYHNTFGDYSYRDVPVYVFPFETRLIEEGEYCYRISTPEKALCDKLYELKPVSNLAELRELMFENLRIDENLFTKLDFDVIHELSALYRSANVRFLSQYVRRNNI